MTITHWRQSTLEGLVDPSHGLQTGPFGSQLHASDYKTEGVPVVMPRDLAGNVISDANISRVSPEKAEQLSRYRLRPGDIIMARRGKIGRCALVTATADGWLCGTGCLRVRLAPPVAPGFLVQLLQWRQTIAWLADHAVGQTMPNLNTRILGSLPLDIPPPDIQHRIAQVLDSVDTTISATRQVMEQTLKIKEGFLQHLLTHGTLPPSSEDHSKNSNSSAEWQVRPIGELCSLINGYGFKAAQWSTRGTPIIRIQNLNGSRDFKFFAGELKDHFVVEEGELLFAWAGVKGVSFGPRIWSGPRGLLNQHIYRVRPVKGISKIWLFETLRQMTRRFEERAQGFKASLLHIRKSDITENEVPVPSCEVQELIAERSNFLTKLKVIEQSNLDGLLKMKRALMSDLFSGTVSDESLRSTFEVKLKS